MSEQAAQSQESLTDQLHELVHLATVNGLYDAADWIKNRTMSASTTRLIVTRLTEAGAGLLGDGDGTNWDLNAEYTRGIVELISEVSGGDKEETMSRLLVLGSALSRG